MDTLSLIEEIINKEFERYELDKTGFITDRQKWVRTLAGSKHTGLNADCSGEEFEQWKRNLLTHLYQEKNYASFFHKEKKSRPVYRLIRRLMKNIINDLWKGHKEQTIDHELRITPSRTVAFKLSVALFAEIYPEIFTSQSLYVTPAQVERQCNLSAAQIYPIEWSKLTERLEKNDSEFWEEMMSVIRKVCYFVLRDKNIGDHSGILLEDLCSDLLLSFQEQIRKEHLRDITSGVHLLNSLRVTCRNKLYESLRTRDKYREELLDECDWNNMENLPSPDSGVPEEIPGDDMPAFLSDINPLDDYELSCAVTRVLCHGHGPVYEQLVCTDKEKVDVLMMHTYGQMSYEEIACELYATGNIKIYGNLRQTVKRIKKLLKSRMKKIIIELKTTGSLFTTNKTDENEKMHI